MCLETLEFLWCWRNAKLSKVGPQHSWSLSLADQTAKVTPPVVPSPVRTEAQTGCENAQRAARTLLREQICRDQTTPGGFTSNHGERTEPQQRLGRVTMARGITMVKFSPVSWRGQGGLPAVQTQVSMARSNVSVHTHPNTLSLATS